LVADPRFATNPARVQNRETLVPMLGARIGTRDADDLLESLAAAGVPSGKIRDVPDALAAAAETGDPATLTVEHSTLGTLELVLALASVAASAAGAAQRETGTIVVRLVTDPSPPGVSWSYSGLGAPFQLGVGGTQRVVSGLQAAPYKLVEAGVDPAQARTLTA